MIYCVEDERNIRELLVYTLGTTGFEARGLKRWKRTEESAERGSAGIDSVKILCCREKTATVFWRS